MENAVIAMAGRKFKLELLHGSILVGLVVGVVILTLSILLYAKSLSSATVRMRELHETLIAEGHIVELLEFFRSMTNQQIIEFLKVHPLDRGVVSKKRKPYFLCAHVNLLDRGGTGRILNPDPIANILNSPLDGPNFRAQVNRFYLVRLVDLATLKKREERGLASECSETAREVDLNKYSLPTIERIEVTVGVSWVSQARPGETRRVSLKTLLPEVGIQ